MSDLVGNPSRRGSYDVFHLIELRPFGVVNPGSPSQGPGIFGLLNMLSRYGPFAFTELSKVGTFW